MKPRPKRKRRFPWTPTFLAGVPAVLVGAGIFWWVVGGPNTYFLDVDDSKGIQVGDPVMRRGVAVGRVMSVEPVEGGTRVEFGLQAAEQLDYEDLVTLRKPVFSARSELRITSGCDGGAVTSHLDSGRLPFGSKIEEAASWAVIATQVRCSEIGQWIEERLGAVDLDRSVEAFSAAVDELKARGSSALSEGRDIMTERGVALLERLEKAGLSERADSLRAKLEELRRSRD